MFGGRAEVQNSGGEPALLAQLLGRPLERLHQGRRRLRRPNRSGPVLEVRLLDEGPFELVTRCHSIVKLSSMKDHRKT